MLNAADILIWGFSCVSQRQVPVTASPHETYILMVCPLGTTHWTVQDRLHFALAAVYISPPCEAWCLTSEGFGSN